MVSNLYKVRETTPIGSGSAGTWQLPALSSATASTIDTEATTNDENCVEDLLVYILLMSFFVHSRCVTECVARRYSSRFLRWQDHLHSHQ